MQTLQTTAFDDFENPQIIWEIYGDLLDIYDDEVFTARQIAYETGHSKKLINKIIHRLIQHKAVEQAYTDHWGVKTYRLNKAFTGY